jgi:hypothetical protein
VASARAGGPSDGGTSVPLTSSQGTSYTVTVKGVVRISTLRHREVIIDAKVMDVAASIPNKVLDLKS